MDQNSESGSKLNAFVYTTHWLFLFAGHRFRHAYDFDYVALDLLSVYPEDSGVYTCHARNAYGEAVSSATIKIFGKYTTTLCILYLSPLSPVLGWSDLALVFDFRNLDTFLLIGYNFRRSIPKYHNFALRQVKVAVSRNLLTIFYFNNPAHLGD